MLPVVAYKKLVGAVRNVDDDAIESILSCYPNIMAWHDYAILKQETNSELLEIFFQHGLSMEKAQQKLIPQIIYSNDVQLLGYLHHKGMNISDASLDILRKAIEEVSMEVVKYMIEHSTYDANSYQCEVQHLYHHGSTELLDLLPEEFIPYDVNCALVNIMLHGNLNHVQRLVKLGANFHYQNDMPILRAFGERRLETVKYILEHHSIDFLSHDGFMLHASVSQEDDFCEFLCSYLYEHHFDNIEHFAEITQMSILEIYKNKIIMDKTLPMSSNKKSRLNKI